MNNTKNTIRKRVYAGLAASAIAVSAVALSPNIQSGLLLTPAFADAVRVDAPKAQGFADVVEAVSPAVVSVRVEQVIQPASEDDRDDEEFRFDRRFGGGERDLPEFFKNNPDLFKRFFGERGPRGERGMPPHGKRRFGSSQGSGFFISEDGYLVTNNHVIDGGTKYTVVLNDGSELDARLIGADKRSDLAVLKVESGGKIHLRQFLRKPAAHW